MDNDFCHSSDSNAPLVPRIFQWLDRGSNTTTLTMLHAFGYGTCN
jgi:hypothetical protein